MYKIEIALVLKKEKYDLFFNNSNVELDISPIKKIIDTAFISHIKENAILFYWNFFDSKFIPPTDNADFRSWLADYIGEENYKLIENVEDPSSCNYNYTDYFGEWLDEPFNIFVHRTILINY